MLKFIGDPDPELRDELIYPVFCSWILENETIPKDLLRQILKISLDEEHLFYKIGESGTDSVFTRTFSVLLIPLLLIHHRKHDTFTRDEIMDTYGKACRYFIEESDIRGYVEKSGWAHSVAHGSDALDDLALCSELGYKELKHMLDIIPKKICIDNYVFIHEEDERVVTAIMSILGRNLIPEEEICDWIQRFRDRKGGDYITEKFNLRVNIKNFLRSLYFRISGMEGMENISAEIKTTLKSICKF